MQTAFQQLALSLNQPPGRMDSASPGGSAFSFIPMKAMTIPSMQEVQSYAAKQGLPPNEAEKFFHYYEMVGWSVGRKRMVSWHSALAGWKVRWLERGGQPVKTLSQNMLDLAIKRATK